MSRDDGALFTVVMAVIGGFTGAFLLARVAIAIADLPGAIAWTW